MSDDARKVFPMESVLALVLGKEDVDVKDLAGYLTGRSLTCDCCSRAVGPLAAGWLASLYPAFVELKWDGATPWDSFVASNKSTIGDNVSVPPMNDSLKALAAKTLDILADLDATVSAQKAELAALHAKVAELEPQEAKAQELEKKCNQLEDKVKTMTTDMGALRKELAPYQGKMAVDQQELMTMIKGAIKDNMKGLVVGGAAGAAMAEGADAASEELSDDTPRGITGDFGFNASGDDDDGFGF